MAQLHPVKDWTQIDELCPPLEKVKLSLKAFKIICVSIKGLRLIFHPSKEPLEISSTRV